MSPNPELDRALDRIRECLCWDDSADYHTIHERCVAARDMFHALMADRFSSPFNAHLSQLPQTTIREKQELSRSANSDLRSLGLALATSAGPALLHADPGHRSSLGYFQLRLIATADGRKPVRTSRELFRVDLIGHPVRKEPGAEYWKERIAKRSKSERLQGD